MDPQGRPSRRVAESVATITAADTNTTIRNLSSNRTCIIRKVWAYNGNSAASVLKLGEDDGSSGITERLPRMRLEPGLQEVVSEHEMPAYEFEGDIIAQATAASTGDSAVRVSIEVEEIVGT